jgi:hypothetical protein
LMVLSMLLFDKQLLERMIQVFHRTLCWMAESVWHDLVVSNLLFSFNFFGSMIASVLCWLVVVFSCFSCCICPRIGSAVQPLHQTFCSSVQHFGCASIDTLPAKSHIPCALKHNKRVANLFLAILQIWLRSIPVHTLKHHEFLRFNWWFHTLKHHESLRCHWCYSAPFWQSCRFD